MPVTARLSRRFYEQFGDELANELVDWLNSVDATYRSDLERLNELNFARFDAKLEQRLAQMDAKWEQRFVQMDAKWEQRIAQLDGKWEQRFAMLDAGFDKRLVTGLAALRTDLIRWMFAFWSGTLLALAGFLFAVLRAHAGP